LCRSDFEIKDGAGELTEGLADRLGRSLGLRVHQFSEVQDLEDRSSTSGTELNEAFSGSEAREGEHEFVHLAINVERRSHGVDILEVDHNLGPVPGHVGLSHEVTERIVSSNLTSKRSEAGTSSLSSSLVHESLEGTDDGSHGSSDLSLFLSFRVLGVMSLVDGLVVLKSGEAESFSLGQHALVGLVSIAGHTLLLFISKRLVVGLVLVEGFGSSQGEINGGVEFLERLDDILLEIESVNAGERRNSCDKRLHLFD